MILLRVALILLALLILPDWYLYQTYIRKSSKRWIKLFFWFPSILLLIAMLVLVLLRDTLHNALGIYLIVVLCIVLPKLIFSIASLLFRGTGWLASRYFCYKRNSLCLIGLGFCSLFGLASFGYLLFGAIEGKENFQVREVTFHSPDLPDAFDGYRILQISDLHTGSWNGDTTAISKAIELCNAQHADLAVFTGDLVNSMADELLPHMPVLSRLKAKDGVYSVLGNHDYAIYHHWANEKDRIANIDSLIIREERMGWHMLNNTNHLIKRGDESIALLGVENSGNPPFPNRGNLPKALKGTDGLFKILLSHDPTHWRREVLPETDIQLMLSGHTHDMQFNIFGFSASRFMYPEHNGLYLEGSRGLYVNIGLGFVLFPMRLGAWPEITVITLKKSN